MRDPIPPFQLNSELRDLFKENIGELIQDADFNAFCDSLGELQGI